MEYHDPGGTGLGAPVTETSFYRDNHYVSRAYLKRWASSHERIWTYRILVAHPQVPLWKESSLRGVAYHSYLYTRIVAGHETDEIEKWLEREFETPAEEALQKATSDARLKPDDWRRLVRFLAAQDVRTPARLMEILQRWHTTLPDLMENTLQKAVRRIELAKESGEELPQPASPDGDYLPFRVTTQIEPGQEVGYVKGEIVVGRGLWLFGIRRLLTQTLNVLHQHRWTILSPPEDLLWFTSDDPVIRLNYYGPDRYDFGGGWKYTGTEILLPLSPRHLLYTKVGERPPRRGEILPQAQAEMIRRFIAEHAHRMIFAVEPDAEVPKLHPRTVDADILRDETEQWKKWHEEQTAAERELMGWSAT